MNWSNPFSIFEGSDIPKRQDPLEEIVRNSKPNILVLTPEYATISEALEGLREVYNVSTSRDFAETSKMIEKKSLSSNPSFCKS